MSHSYIYTMKERQNDEMNRYLKIAGRGQFESSMGRKTNNMKASSELTGKKAEHWDVRNIKYKCKY